MEAIQILWISELQEKHHAVCYETPLCYSR